MANMYRQSQENYAQIKQQLRDIYDALCELAYEIITSKTTQKTVLYSILGTTASVIFYGIAIVVYLFCYNRYLPDQVTTVPLHLQYGCVCPSSLPVVPKGVSQANYLTTATVQTPTASPPSPLTASNPLNPTTSP